MSENPTPDAAYRYDSPSHSPKLDWTIMVYLAGDNNLSANSISILQELESAPSSSRVRVLAGYDANNPLPKGARYLEIQHRRYGGSYKWDWGLHNDHAYPEGHIVVTPDFCNEELETVQPIYEPTAREGLSRFLRWALQTHPAKHYMLILFGHGVLVAGNTFLTDVTPPSFLKLSDFTRIIKRHFGASQERRKPQLDILACDNCVMNGIEAAHEIRNHVDYMIGSQDLMLAVGWPFRKIIEVIQRDPTAPRKKIVRRILKACARRLLDYSLMERSSEQAVCNLKVLRKDDLKEAVKALGKAMTKALKTDQCGRVCFPEVRDTIKLARLETQAYWDETYVDLYDFCELLLWKCNQHLSQQVGQFYTLAGSLLGAKLAPDSRREDPCAESVTEEKIKRSFVQTPIGQHYGAIAAACIRVLNEFRRSNPHQAQASGVVPYSYYVCPDLQYSHGLSIYFPWTMPRDPIIFETDCGTHGDPEDYKVKTSFDEYREYEFAGPRGADWASFLIQFFRATLRNVRLVDFIYETASSNSTRLFYETKAVVEELQIAPVDLQKSSPDTGEQDDRDCNVRIKNYPRRFYLSPEDCKNTDKQCKKPPTHDCASPHYGTPPSVYKDNRVSYLGWEIKGLLAEVIAWPREQPNQPIATTRDENESAESKSETND